MDNASFSRVKSWRDSVVKVTQVERTEVETPLVQASSVRKSRLSHRTQREPVSSQVVGDSFASSQNVQPSYTQAERRKSNVLSSAITPRPPIQQPGPSQSERAVSSLRSYTSLATTPARPARKSPDQVQPQPIPDLADKKREQPEETTVGEVADDESSDLSDLSQPTPDASKYEAPPESVSSSSGVSIKVEAEEVVVAPAKVLSALRLHEYSDRSFRFRNVAPPRDLATETISSDTSRRTPVRSLKTEIEEHHDVTQINSVRGLVRTMPQSSNHEVTLVPDDRSPAEPPEDSIVVANEAEVPETHPSHAEHVEVDTTHVTSLDADADASMIDGPTLIPSTVSSDSELSDVASMGNFSCEKQSQALLQEMVQLPRRLLWPKSGKGSADTSLSSDPGVSEADMMKGTLNTEEETTGTSTVAVQQFGSPNMAEEIVVDKATTDEGSTDDYSEQTDDEKEEANIDGGCTTLGTPLPERHEEQSPWRNSQIEVKILEQTVAEPIETEETVDATRDVSQTPPKASWETKSQSPWPKEPTQPPQTLEVPEQPEASPANKDGQTPPFISGQMSEKASQSPWAKGDSQIAVATLPESRLFNPLSSPAKSTSSPLREIALPNLSTLPPRDQGEMSNSQETCPPVPSTPEFKESNLPTPEYTHPIKSFREFLTPSPQKPRKRRRISAVNHGLFPSTQVLVDAAVSNPWLEPSQRNSSRKRKQLRVSWAPLPGEDGEGEEDSSILVAEDASPAGSEFPEEPRLSSSIKIRPKSILRASRASSPPPQSLPKDLPASEKFGKHFAAMANRRVTRPNSSNTVILPTASQQICDSPQVEAMAERFLAADALSSRPRAISVLSEGEIYDRELQGVKSRFISNRISSSQFSTPIKPVEANQDKDSDVELSPGEVVFYVDDEEEEEPESIDPVNDVMQNLDSFLDDTWGFGQKESETLSSGGEPKSSGRNGHRRSSGLRSSGVTDTLSSNVWS